MEHREYDIDNTEWITTRAAAAALGIKPRRVRGYISEGALEARAEGEGANKRYLVPVSSVEALRAELEEEGKTPGRDRVADGAEEALESQGESRIVAEGMTKLVRELTAELGEARYELGRAEARLEAAVRAERALQEHFGRERERADRLEAERDRLFPELLRERDKASAQRERAEHFENELREALEAQRGWLRRFFGF